MVVRFMSGRLKSATGFTEGHEGNEGTVRERSQTCGNGILSAFSSDLVDAIAPEVARVASSTSSAELFFFVSFVTFCNSLGSLLY